jgi:hypothetical protein
MTRRDLQDDAKALRRSWELGKGEVALLAHRTVHRQRDGALVRVADLGGATQHADVIFAGTPEGVGAVARGQTMVGAIEGVGEIRLTVVSATDQIMSERSPFWRTAPSTDSVMAPLSGWPISATPSAST